MAPDVANSSLAGFLREIGRGDAAICLYVDPATGLDASSALGSLQASIDALVQQGYTILGTRPASACPQEPHFIRTNSVHPKYSGAGPVMPVPVVKTVSPYQLFFVVTTDARIDQIFGGLVTRRGAEEVLCPGNGHDCASVTESVYVDPVSFSGASERERWLLEGLGLLGDPN